jgi:hypothetical protein
MDMSVDLPLIVTLIVTLELGQVLQAVVTHLAVQDSLDLILLLTIDEGCGWRRRRLSAKDRIRRGRGQLDHREDGVKAAEVVREFEAVYTMADASFDNKGA